ncbi:MAG: hypothetical protein EPO02_00300 [Nitrospirae bacterium]|nr:MAG: hypothetical protein EPO02_00300 [Nitrospirota bacterium]
MVVKRKKAQRKGRAHLKVVRPQYTLCYGMRLDSGTAPEQAHPHVPVSLPDGTQGEMSLHVINGSVKEIRAHLLQSIDAFFEIYGNEKL